MLQITYWAEKLPVITSRRKLAKVQKLSNCKALPVHPLLVNVVKVSFLTSLKIFAGMILFLIPGIYWAYCYALVPYLLAENPYMSTSRAMELSREMMYGEKFHFFLLELSFLGWALLCVLTLGIGIYFLSPYLSATYAEFYAAMRAKALAQGLSTTQELGGFVRHKENI